MNSKVTLITFCHWKSIGSILQSYALSQILRDHGYDNEVWLEEWNRTFRSSHQTFRGLLKKLYKMPLNNKFRSAYHKRMSFISKHINVQYLSAYEDFEQRACQNRSNVYLAGSDQIWHPDQRMPLYFLNFAKNSKRVSYAASMGKTEITTDKEAEMSTLLHGFDSISVREKACADTLKRITDQEISVHVDPTFLISKEKWRSLEVERKIKKPYILLYMLYWDQAIKAQIEALKKRTGLPVYAICADVSRVFADKHLYDVSVEEFLWLIDHAEYIVTSSFHGVALSIIFQKKFAAVINPRSPSRIANVLEVLSVPLVSISELDSTTAFNYRAITEAIDKERNRSIAYLMEAIG